MYLEKETIKITGKKTKLNVVMKKLDISKISTDKVAKLTSIINELNEKLVENGISIKLDKNLIVGDNVDNLIAMCKNINNALNTIKTVKPLLKVDINIPIGITVSNIPAPSNFVVMIQTKTDRYFKCIIEKMS